MYEIEVIIIDSMESDLDSKEERDECSERFKKSIDQIIKYSGQYPIIGDWIKPLNDVDGTVRYDIGEVKGRDFDPNRNVIRYEIA